jgi:hypothetical protein
MYRNAALHFPWFSVLPAFLITCLPLLHRTLASQALLMHNQVIKHAVYDQVGYVLEQEGDSFTVSFYEPEDAVAFTLQVREVHSKDG